MNGIWRLLDRNRRLFELKPIKLGKDIEAAAELRVFGNSILAQLGYRIHLREGVWRKK